MQILKKIKDWTAKIERTIGLFFLKEMKENLQKTKYLDQIVIFENIRTKM